jgi:hypothetical protein
MRIFLIAAFIALAAFGGAAWLAFSCEDDWCLLFEWQKVRVTRTFDECAFRGFPVLDAKPPECRAGDKIFYAGVTKSTSTKQLRERSGVWGRVTQVSPCANQYERANDPACAPPPYMTKVIVYTLERRKIAEMKTADDGFFEIPLPPGEYIVGPVNSKFAVGRVPEPREIIVAEGKYVRVNFVFGEE